MTSIPTFGKSLLDNPSINPATAPKVEDILQTAPSAPPAYNQPADSFERTDVMPRKGGNSLLPLITTAVGATGLFLAGRKGWFGKTIKTWFGGRPSLKKAHNKIAEQMKEYMSRFGEVEKTSVLKNNEGKHVLDVTMKDGSVKSYTFKDNNSTIQLTGKNPDGLEETIIFGREDVAPKTRTMFIKDGSGKTKAYSSFKGGDILNRDFDEATGIYKESATSNKRRFFFGLIGPKKNVVTTKTYNNPDTGKPNTEKVKSYFWKGSKSKVKVTNQDGTKIFKYDANGNVSRVKVKPKNGKAYYEHYEYSFNIDNGKFEVINIKKTSDKAGKKVIS